MINETVYMPTVYRIQLVRESTEPMTQLLNSFDAFTILQEYFKTVDREHFVILMLDTKNQIIGLNTVGIGTLTTAVVSGREVFKAAILCNAAGIILAHNHPSGITEPSSEDIAMTRGLVSAGALLEIPVYDHIIIGGSNYYSFAQHGILNN